MVIATVKSIKLIITKIWFPVLFLACIIIRFVFLDIIEFKDDEFIAIKMAYDNLYHQFTLTGLKSSTGLYNPPFFIYLISIPVFFSTDPILVTVFISILNAIALLLLYWFSRSLYGKNTTPIICLIFASAPWTIIYSRKIWAQDCLFLFIMLFYLVMVSFIRKYRSSKVVLLFILLAAITQLHMSAWFLPLPLLIFFVLFRIKIRLRDLVLGLLLFAFCYSPYLVFHLTTDFENLRTFFQERSGWRSFANFEWSFIITGGANFTYYIGENAMKLFNQKYFLALPSGFFFLYYLFALAGLVYVFFLVLRKYKFYFNYATIELKYQILILMLLIYFTIQICYFVFRIRPHPHYNIIFYPIISICAALFFEYLIANTKEWMRKAIYMILTLIVISNLYYTGAFYQFIRKNPETISGDYGKPYFVTKDHWHKKLPVR